MTKAGKATGCIIALNDAYKIERSLPASATRAETLLTHVALEAPSILFRQGAARGLRGGTKGAFEVRYAFRCFLRYYYTVLFIGVRDL